MEKSGVSGRDVHWDAYGDYLNRLEEAVQAEWDATMSRAEYPPPGTTVIITFVLTSKGEISKFVHVDKSATCTRLAEEACADSLTHPAPYGKWTEPMIKDLGTEQTLTFQFFYE